ncbi:MAG: DUF4249 family protein [Bacteroidales bacterium]|nr:DUF4249 family protein [Bacteroidales bacterium]
MAYSFIKESKIIKESKFFFFWVILLFFVNSCVYSFSPVVSGGAHYIVINGDILIGKESQISVSRANEIGQELIGKIRADAVYVEGSDNSRYDGRIQNDNSYLVDLSSANPEGEYRLVVEMGNSIYESEWSPVLHAPEIDSVSYTINDGRDVMTIDISAHSDTDNRYYRWLANQVWEYHAQDYALAYYDPAVDSILFYENGQNDEYFCWDSAFVPDLMIASTEQMSENRFVRHALFSMNNREQRVSYIYSVEIYQESISERAYRFFSSVRSNSSRVGGLFSPQPTEVRGNIVNRNDGSELVLGFISVTKPETKRIIIECATLGFSSHGGRDPYNAETNPFSLPVGTDWNSYYHRGYQVLDPILDDNSNLIIGWRWIRTSCVRCTLHGGTKEKPDWWPIDDQ